MLIAAFWALVLLLFLGASLLGRRLGLAGIISQLLLAAFVLPPLLLLWIEPHWQLSTASLLAPATLELAYGLAFALLLGYILSDVVDLQISAQSLRIALPSFAVPFLCGLSCAWWLLQQPWLSAVAIGLLFSITAIPVLYLYLQNIGYPPARIRTLLHAAILMDVACWSLFALAQGSSQPHNLLWPLLAAALPLPLRLLGLRHPLGYSLPFFGLMAGLHLLGLNALVFGILYMVCLALLRQPFRLPLPLRQWKLLINGLAVPLILTCGVLEVQFRSVLQDYSWLYLLVLLVLPVASKIGGSWIGLHWADRSATAGVKWRESLLLNIRGLTEIMFLNLLLQQDLIDSAVYFSLLLMSLFSTLLPVVLRLRRTAAGHSVEARAGHGVREP